jgi:hypothetical protein
MGNQTDIAQCAFECCTVTIVDASRLRVNRQFILLTRMNHFRSGVKIKHNSCLCSHDDSG